MGPRPKSDSAFVPAPTLALAVFLPSLLFASGRFQGSVEMQLTMEDGAGGMRLLVGADKAELQVDAFVGALQKPLRVDIVQDAKAPDSLIVIDHGSKTFAKVSAAAAARLSAADSTKYRVKALGREKILGVDCEHVALTRDRELVDACIAPEMRDVYGALRRLQAAGDARVGQGEIFRALEAAGRTGLPMRCTVIREGRKVTLSVRKVERRAVPDSEFAPPKDYHASAANNHPSAPASPAPAPAKADAVPPTAKP